MLIDVLVNLPVLARMPSQTHTLIYAHDAVLRPLIPTHQQGAQRTTMLRKSTVPAAKLLSCLSGAQLRYRQLLPSTTTLLGVGRELWRLE